MADPWRFDVTEVAGQGTTGTVWRATDRRTGHAVALKVANDPQGEAALAYEAEALLLADSAFVPSVIDLGRVPAHVQDLPPQSAYLALRWVPGRRLQPLEIASDERRAVALALARDVGAALDDLHQAGTAHGDVKPANILVTPEAGGYRAVLVDLGFATDVESDTLHGATLRYLPPEAAQGMRHAVAQDLWALGVCLAETLDASVAAAADPADRIWAAQLAAPMAGWIKALTASRPAARPSASWIRAAAQREGVALPADTQGGAKRVRASYLRVRRAELEAARDATSVQLRGEVAPWLPEAVEVVRAARRLRREASRPGSSREIAAMDAAGRKRWFVSLVGVGAAGWSLPTSLVELPETKLAAALERLAQRLEPALWSLQDVVRAVENDLPTRTRQASRALRDPVELALALARRPVDVAVLDEAERMHRCGELPVRHQDLLAEALRSAGQLGRAFALLEGSDRGRHQVLRAELLRRMGKVRDARRLAEEVLKGAGARGRQGSGWTSERASAVLARAVLDAGDPEGALSLLGSASGAAVNEVRALANLTSGRREEALRAVEEGLAMAGDDETRARLLCVRGMEAHARGAARRAFRSFARAAEHAERAGAVEEEATYLTGLAAAAVDAGRVSTALDASMRASLLWEHLEQPSKLAYALLARAAAFFLAGAGHDARKEAERGLELARAAGDERAAAYLAMLLCDVAVDAPEEAVRHAQQARRSLGTVADSDDDLRVAARLLRVGTLDDDAVRAMDRLAETAGATACAEWWTSRAEAWMRGRRLGRDGELVARLMRLVREALPTGVKGPALDASRSLAAQAGDGESTRLLASMQVRLSLELLEHVPSWLRDRTSSVRWLLEAPAGGEGVSAEQARNLETLVRSLAGRESLRRLLERALDALVLWTGVERGLLLLRAPDERLVVRAARNLERRDLRGEQLDLSHSLARRALSSGEPVVAVDAAGELADVHRSVHALGLRSVLAVPLLARGEALGVAYLDDRVRKGAFGPRELAWVRLVADIAAMAILDARSQLLLRREARRAKRAEKRLKESLARREAELDLAERELAREKGRPRGGYEAIVGESAPVRAMLSMVDRVAAADLPVLVEGESGSGKELVARALHDNSPRAGHPFVAENCSAIPEPLFESTLFGHMRGAFTGADRRRMGVFEVADAGTLFLDEVGEIPLRLQSKLLRVLQDGEVHPLGGSHATKVDVRVIAATNKDLRDLVAAGRFREDLFYRLNVITIRVPSLRERIEDVTLLVRHFLAKYGQGKEARVSRGAWTKLESYDWPGNVRQLENEIRRALVLCDEVIRPEDLTDQVRGERGSRAPSAEGMNLKARVAALERGLVQDALARTGGNQTRAARMLGVSRYGLQKMIKRLEIG